MIWVRGGCGLSLGGLGFRWYFGGLGFQWFGAWAVWFLW